MSAQGRILEVFSSLQGEGLRVGERQIFVRFGGCNLHCDYCDTPDSIPMKSGSLWGRDKVVDEILKVAGARAHRSISWTGGEPLIHASFLEGLMEWAKTQGFSNYLETNGMLPDALKKVAGWVDSVAMDLKLPSSTGRETWSLHRDFLAVAPEKTFVKVVLTKDSTDSEWRHVIRLLQEAGPQIPLVLQPATPVADTRDPRRRVEPISPERAISFLRQARGLLKDVRIIPQWHPLWRMP